MDDDKHSVLPFSAALLDAASLPDQTATGFRQAKSMAASNDHPYDYNTGEHIHKNFPARERQLAILRRFDGTVYIDK